MAERLLILGTSVRAAAFSALRVGVEPSCGDLFGDADLERVCPVAVTTDYPFGLEAIARAAPHGPWMYTGGLENYPDLIESISYARPLYGNRRETLAAVRDPFRLARVVRRAGLPVPDCRPDSRGLPGDGTWLRKHRRTSGGLRVHAWRGSQRQKTEAADGCWYFQRRIGGTPCAALYVAAGGRARLLGATEQLLASTYPSHDAFCYAGSLGLMPLGGALRESLTTLGASLAESFHLVGLFGVDFILNEQGPWTVEVNPRYTASVEIWEWAARRSAMALHLAACRDGVLPADDWFQGELWYGKQILFARHPSLVDGQFSRAALNANEGRKWPVVADIPRTGTRLQIGQPVLTVFAQGPSRETTLSELAARCETWQEKLPPAC